MKTEISRNLRYRQGSKICMWIAGIALLAIVCPNIAFARRQEAKTQWLLVGAALVVIGNVNRWMAQDARVVMNDTEGVARQVRRQNAWAFFEASAEEVQDPQPQLALPEGPPNIPEEFDIVEAFGQPTYPHFYLVAPSGSGKSTTLRWLLDLSAQSGSQVTICTPHLMDEDLYGPHRLVTDRLAIYNEIDKLWMEMDRRYKLRPWKDHRDQLPHITLAMDEATSLFMDFKDMDKEYQQDVSKKWVRLLIEARKAKIRIIVAGHTNNVDGLGLRGRGDIRECLTRILVGSSGKKRLSMLKRRKWWPKEHVQYVQDSGEHFAIVEDVDNHKVLWIPELNYDEGT